MTKRRIAMQMQEDDEDEIIEPLGFGDFDEEPRRSGGWMLPSFFLLVAMVGFGGLGWYAYHVGTQAPAEDELVLIEPDKTPIKEQPLDPGGMKVDNQDKTVFDATTSPQAKPLVAERVLPMPEEPMDVASVVPTVDTTDATKGEAKTWINEKLRTDVEAKSVGSTESTAGPSMGTPAKEVTKPAKFDPPAKVKETAKAATDKAAPKSGDKPVAGKTESEGNIIIAEDGSVSAAESLPVTTSVVSTPPKETAKPQAEKEEPKAAVSAKKETTPATVAPASTKGSGTIQLGAFKSEEEAAKYWNKISPQIGLNAMKPSITETNVEGKGVFYRLRTSGVDAKALCADISAKKMPCMVVK